MADLKEIELPIARDCNWVRGLDANGNPIRIAKADLLGTMFQHRGASSDADKALQSGIYSSQGMNNTPILDYCTMVVFASNIYVHQLYFPLNSIKIFYRFTIDNGKNWRPWMEISFI